MADAKFKATLPKDEQENGLAGPEWNRALLNDPDKEHVAIVTFRAVDAKGLPGYQVAIAGFTRFEPVTDEAEEEVLRQKLGRFQAERRGLSQLPLQEREATVTELPSVLDVDSPEEAGSFGSNVVTVTLTDPEPEGGDAA